MDMDAWALAKATIALFVVVDPFGNIPIFIGILKGMGKDERGRALKVALVTGFVILMVLALTANLIFELFGISLASFKIAGGLLLLVIAMKILIQGSWEEVHEATGAVPLGFPLLVGPGAITTTIINIGSYGMPVTMASIVIVFCITWLAFRSIDRIYSFLGKTGAVVVARVMALFIAAIATQFIIDGVLYYTS